MKIQFTAQQFIAVSKVATSVPLLAEWVTPERVIPVGRTASIVEAPYVAWLQLRDILLGQLHKPSGARVRSVPRSQGKATQKIVAAINAADRHPALRDVAMASLEADSFPVWELAKPDERGRVWSMYPTPGAHFAVLVPHWDWSSGLTYWRPNIWAVDRPANPLYDERTHLQLIGL